MLNISINPKKDKNNNRQSFLGRKREPRSRPISTSSFSSTDSDQSEHRFYNRLSRMFGNSAEQLSVDEDYSSAAETSNSSHSSKRYARKHFVHREETVPAHKIPPYSPTGAWNGKFPYSNFYVRLPNGKWMIRYRSGDRDILGTDEFEGYMI
ncbi:hypothetical protein INT44_000762 [Umbelopsis vinacea]|uniref:Uncharacterized protein n=1 Tax=Umbelopsis vinacea TaxID=44442 RepID=A0A8H7QAW4_9FUNG|nr:hypothetical protein INT44_000762 [Umbelopsis vinacea]